MKYFLIALFSLISYQLTAQQQLSEQAQISIITCGPDQNELYAAFGHSAIRVYDPTQGIDDAYNYGIFDFNQPNFYLNFAKGYLYYKLGVYPYPLFRDFYVSYNRFVHEQVLNLSQEQKQKIYEYLIWNARPENQTYRYDYFYNNCATKVRDVFAEVLKDDVNFDGSFITTNYTIRDLTDLYLSPLPWGDLGIDICLGLPMDKKASPYEYMFLPDYIESSFNHASINLNGKKLPIVQNSISVYETSVEEMGFNWLQPIVLFTILLVIILAITWHDWKEKKSTLIIDYVLFTVLGLIGILLLALWLFTDHQAAAKNFNLLWAMPTHVIVSFLIFSQKKKVQNYFKAVAVVTVLLLVLWPFLPQQLNTSLLPLVFIVVVRSAFNGFSSLNTFK